MLEAKFKMPSIIDPQKKETINSTEKDESDSKSEKNSSESDDYNWIKNGKKINLPQEKCIFKLIIVSDGMLNNILGKIDKHINENFNDK
jgi:hypothetical protein